MGLGYGKAILSITNGGLRSNENEGNCIILFRKNCN